MPSLNLRNVLRRNPNRPGLRERAEALKVSAGRLIRRKDAPAEISASAPLPADAAIPDPVLAAYAAARAADAEMAALQRQLTEAMTPGWFEREAALSAVQVAAHEAAWRMVPTTHEGRRAFVDYARAQVEIFTGPSGRLDCPDDLLRSVLATLSAMVEAERAQGGPIVTAEARDPHLALLPALRQAFAWTRDAAPIDNNGPTRSPDHGGAVAVMRHCWSIASRILDLPAPKTLDGLGVVALALSVWTEGMIGKDLDRCRDERRTASAVRAMMSVAGAEFLPEWTGFGDEPDSEARWEAMMERAGEGSLPAWALAGMSGPDEGHGLAQACIDMAERLDWLDQNENVSGFSEEAWDAEFNRQGAVFRRAIDEPSADASDLAAKARLALSDLDRFRPADRFQGDGDRLMRVVLREAMMRTGKSGLSDEGAADEGTPEIDRIIEEPAASLPILDLSSCSIPQIARLYEAFHATYDHLSALGQLSCFWENSADASRARFNPAGDIVDQEADRLAELFGACAEEIARREPRSARESGEILLTRVMHELTCNGCIDDPALMRDVTTAWGA